MDTLIREKTKGQRALDDFCRRFHGGEGGNPSLKPFTLDDLVADLDAVCPHDWKTLLTKRLTTTGPEAPLDGIRRGGWKLAYAEKPTTYLQASETENKVLDLTASLGLALKDDGTVTDVVPGKTAHKSGVGPGMKVIAVNGRRWSAAGMRAGLAATKESGKVELIVENGEFFRNVAVPYRDGARYPRLERDGAGTDLIAEIVRPRGEDSRTAK